MCEVFTMCGLKVGDGRLLLISTIVAVVLLACPGEYLFSVLADLRPFVVIGV